VKPDETAKIGPHTMEFYAPDIVIYRLVGELEADQIVTMAPQQIEWCGPEHDYVLAVLDVRAFTSVTTAAMRAARSTRPIGTRRAFAVIGTGFRARVAVDMLTRALRFLSKARLVLRYCQDDADALAWLAEQRTWIREKRG